MSSADKLEKYFKNRALLRQSPRIQKSPAKIVFFCGSVLLGSLSVRIKCWLLEQILPKIELLCAREQGRSSHSPKTQVTHKYTSCIHVNVFFFFLAVSCVHIWGNVLWLFPKRDRAILWEPSNLVCSIVVYRNFFRNLSTGRVPIDIISQNCSLYFFLWFIVSSNLECILIDIGCSNCLVVSFWRGFYFGKSLLQKRPSNLGSLPILNTPLIANLAHPIYSQTPHL